MTSSRFVRAIGKIGIMLFFILCSFGSARAATYYVDNVNGLDTNNGTSLGAAFQTLARGASSTNAGDTMFIVNNGVTQPYREDLAPLRSGTATNTISFAGYSGSPVLLGTTDYSNSTTTGWIWQASSVAGEYYLTLNGGNPGIAQPAVLATSLATTWTTSGVNALANRTSAVVTALGVGQCGWGNADSLAYSTVYYKLATGETSITSTHIEISVATVARQNPIVNSHNYISFQNLAILYSNSHGILNSGSNNTYANLSSSYTGRGGLSGGTASGLVISGSTFDHNGLAGVATAGIQFSNTTSSTVKYNVISNCLTDSGITVKVSSNNNQFFYNVIFGNFQHGIDIGSSTASQVENNVFYGNTHNGINLSSTSTSTFIRNNIMASNAGFQFAINDTGSTSGLSTDYNDLYVVSSTTNIINDASHLYSTNAFSTYQSASGYDAHSLTGNPGFANGSGLFSQATDFKLSSSSSALVNAGTSVGLTRDYPGTSVPQGALPDIGAYEFLLPSAATSLAQYKSDGTTPIASGAYTNQATAVFKFSQSSSNVSDSLVPQIELQPNGTAFTNTLTSTGTAVAFIGSSVTGTVTVSGLSSGTLYHWQAGTSNAAGQGTWTASGGSPDFGVDTQAPTVPGTPATGSASSNTMPTWTWATSSDALSGLAATPYTIQWSQDPGFASNVGSGTASSNSFTHASALADGTWYFRVAAMDAAGNSSAYSAAGTDTITTADSFRWYLFVQHAPQPSPSPSPSPIPSFSPTVSPSPSPQPTPSMSPSPDVTPIASSSLRVLNVPASDSERKALIAYITRELEQLLIEAIGILQAEIARYGRP